MNRWRTRSATKVLTRRFENTGACRPPEAPSDNMAVPTPTAPSPSLATVVASAEDFDHRRLFATTLVKTIHDEGIAG